MRRPRHIIIDGKSYLWRDILELRRQQTAETADDSRQLLLFELRYDPRPANERSAAQRYLEPTLFSIADQRGSITQP